ncbi:hypothetical protein NBRC116597_17630 [Phaeobacter sp. NW0010-22]
MILNNRSQLTRDRQQKCADRNQINSAPCLAVYVERMGDLIEVAPHTPDRCQKRGVNIGWLRAPPHGFRRQNMTGVVREGTLFSTSFMKPADTFLFGAPNTQNKLTFDVFLGFASNHGNHFQRVHAPGLG